MTTRQAPKGSKLVSPGRPMSGDPTVDGLLTVAHGLREQFNAKLTATGLSLWTFKTLRAIDTLGPSRARDVSDLLGMTPRTVTDAVDQLESVGLVTREPHPTDRRSALLVLTDEGRERLTEARDYQTQMTAIVNSPLSPAERETLVDMLARMAGALSETRAANCGIPRD